MTPRSPSGPGPVAATLPFLLLAEGCASGGTGALTRDAGTVEVVTGEGCAHEVRRGPEVLAEQLVEASPDLVWSLLPQVFTALELERDVQDSRAHTLGVSATASPGPSWRPAKAGSPQRPRPMIPS